MTESGSVVICGRIKEMIIRGGENIYPAEIEEYLFKHPDIRSVYVVGVPDERFGEEVCAVVVRKEDRNITEQDIRDYCKGQISHFKIPRYIMFKTEEYIPFTATGKAQKVLLKKKCAKELRVNQPKGE